MLSHGRRASEGRRAVWKRRGPSGHTREGSLAVETAIFLPLFIIGVLTLGWLIRFTAVSENVYHALSDETRRYAASATLSRVPAGYAGAVKSRVADENEGEVTSIEVSPVRFNFPYASAASGRTYTNLIGASVSYKANLSLNRIFANGLTGSETIVCRAFVGAKNPGERMTFDEMENGDDSHLVWVFPRAGERYHGETCSYIKNNPREQILTSAIRGRYSPCRLCKPGGAPDGTLAYVFPSAGGAYHLGNCYIVERYVISMSEDDAQGKGYTKCAKCGGR
jgi:Flp pilus assembly protein TadG